METSVAIEAFRLIAEPLSSIAVYVSELTKYLSALSEIQKIYLLLPRKPASNFIYSKLLELEKIEFIYPVRDFFPEDTFWSEVYWTQWTIPRLIQSRIGLSNYYIAPYHHPPLFLSKGIVVVTVIHDLCGLRADCGYGKTNKGFYQHLFRFVMASIRSNLLIPISEYTSRQVKERFPFLPMKISNVVYNGISCKTLDESMTKDTLQKYGLHGKQYFIGFGSPGPRKSIDLILGAYKRYSKYGGQSSLALVVSHHYLKTIQELVNTDQLEDVIMVSDISAIERDALYKGALALLFPSRCEGFGYPIVEAMRQGCPPIVYQEGPASEILGSVFPLLKKLDIEDILEYMLTIEGLDVNTRFELNNRLIERSLLFTGETFGRDFFEAMKQLT